jgi:hypothetical protein
VRALLQAAMDARASNLELKCTNSILAVKVHLWETHGSLNGEFSSQVPQTSLTLTLTDGPPRSRVFLTTGEVVDDLLHHHELSESGDWQEFTAHGNSTLRELEAFEEEKKFVRGQHSSNCHHYANQVVNELTGVEQVVEQLWSGRPDVCAVESYSRPGAILGVGSFTFFFLDLYFRRIPPNWVNPALSLSPRPFENPVFLRWHRNFSPWGYVPMLPTAEKENCVAGSAILFPSCAEALRVVPFFEDTELVSTRDILCPVFFSTELFIVPILVRMLWECSLYFRGRRTRGRLVGNLIKLSFSMGGAILGASIGLALSCRIWARDFPTPREGNHTSSVWGNEVRSSFVSTVRDNFRVMSWGFFPVFPKVGDGTKLHKLVKLTDFIDAWALANLGGILGSYLGVCVAKLCLPKSVRIRTGTSVTLTTGVLCLGYCGLALLSTLIS